MGRKLFCEISPTTYKISMEKNILQRHLKDFFSREHFAHKKSNEPLPVIIKKHNSLIRRRLGNVDMQLQGEQGRQPLHCCPLCKRHHHPSWRDVLLLATGGTRHEAARLQGRTGHSPRLSYEAQRRRHVPVHKPHPLDGAPFRPHHHRAPPSRRARSLP